MNLDRSGTKENITIKIEDVTISYSQLPAVKNVFCDIKKNQVSSSTFYCFK